MRSAECIPQILCSLLALFALSLSGLAQGPVDQSEIIEVASEAGEEQEVSTLEQELLSEAETALIKELFSQLGNASFQKREEATTRLIAFGPRAVAVLKENTATSKDPEVVARSQLIIDHLEKSGIPARIDLFMKSPGDVQQHKFYGWNRFSEIAGTSRLARRIFADMLVRHDRLCNEDVSDRDLATLNQKL